MSTKTYLDAAAEAQNDIDDIVEDKRPEFMRIRLELLENPEQREPAIMDFYLASLEEQTALESGNEEMAAAYWSGVEELAAQSWSELYQTPVEERGDMFATAAKLILATTWEQAFIECGAATELMVTAAETAPEQKARFDAMSPVEQKKTALFFPIKSKKKELRKKKEGEKNGNTAEDK